MIQPKGEETLEKVKKLLQKTPNALLCVLGAALFLLVFYKLAYRTPLGEIWLVPSMDNDEVIYNRQVVSILTHGGPQGYFGYEETHANIGHYGTWGPLLIWVYALPGFLFGSSVNTVLWCNVLFAIAGLAVFVFAARLPLWQAAVFALAYVCVWAPIDFIFSGSSESLHYALALIIVGSSAALARRNAPGWLAVAAVACALETIFRPYALLFWVGMVGLGLVVPLLMYIGGGHSAASTVVAPILVLCGGCLLRFMVVNTDDRAEIPGENRYYNRVAKNDAEFITRWTYGDNEF